jgi:hypothetical protein
MIRTQHTLASLTEKFGSQSVGWDRTARLTTSLRRLRVFNVSEHADPRLYTGNMGKIHPGPHLFNDLRPDRRARI